jgi:hypothetical protein
MSHPFSGVFRFEYKFIYQLFVRVAWFSASVPTSRLNTQPGFTPAAGVASTTTTRIPIQQSRVKNKCRTAAAQAKHDNITVFATATR